MTSEARTTLSSAQPSPGPSQIGPALHIATAQQIATLDQLESLQDKLLLDLDDLERRVDSLLREAHRLSAGSQATSLETTGVSPGAKGPKRTNKGSRAA